MAPREYFPVLSSSQDRALELARAGAEPGTRVVVGQQTGGRGRHGAPWSSPPGGLYLSLVLDASPPEPGLVPLAVAAGVADALERLCPLEVRLKWPNDLLLAGTNGTARKLGGILVDRVGRSDGAWADVVGIGINRVAPDDGWSADGPTGPIALGERVVPPSLGALEATVAAAAVRAHTRSASVSGRNELLADCRRRLWGVGRLARLDGRPVGRIERLADDGSLEVSGTERPLELRTGRLTVEEEPA